MSRNTISAIFGRGEPPRDSCKNCKAGRRLLVFSSLWLFPVCSPSSSHGLFTVVACYTHWVPSMKTSTFPMPPTSWPFCVLSPWSCYYGSLCHLGHHVGVGHSSNSDPPPSCRNKPYLLHYRASSAFFTLSMNHPSISLFSQKPAYGGMRSGYLRISAFGPASRKSLLT